MQGHTFVARIEAEPIQFMLITFADDYSTVLETTQPVSEDEMRSFLRGLGMPEIGPNGVAAHMASAPLVA